MGNKTLVLFASLALCACGETAAFKAQEALSKVDSGEKMESSKPTCEVDYDEYEINAHVLSYELQGKHGANIGFDLSGLIKLIGVNFESEKGVMQMAMSLSETIKPEEPVAYVTGNGKMNKLKFKFDIGLSKIGLGYEYFKKTPMSELSKKTVNDALKNLEAETDKNAVRWRSKVAFVSSLSVVMPVGASSGVRGGDRFNIYNVDYIWSDPARPCDSSLLLVAPTTSEPLAEAIAIQVENNATLLRIESFNGDEPLEVGARIEINKLAGTPKELKSRKLSRPARIHEVLSQPLVIDEKTYMDLSVPVSEQIRAEMDRFHFHPKN